MMDLKNTLLKLSDKVKNLQCNEDRHELKKEDYMMSLFGFTDSFSDGIFANAKSQREKNKILNSLLQQRAIYDENNGTLTTPGGQYNAGWFISPTVSEIISLVDDLNLENGNPTVAVIQGKDVGLAHLESCDGEVFQGASQLNALEMIDMDQTPWNGIYNYINDNTQGPRMALACAPGTFVRNYWLMKELGQQFNALENLDISHTNGYLNWGTNPSEIKQKLVPNINEIMIPAMIYTQVVGVTKANTVMQHITGKRVHQIYASGAPVNTYRNGGDHNIQLDIVTNLLYAEYLGTIGLAIILHYFDKRFQRTNLSRPRVNLTLVGGGVFNVPQDIIVNVIDAAIKYYKNYSVDIYIHGYSFDAAIFIGDSLNVPVITSDIKKLDLKNFYINVPEPNTGMARFFTPRDYQLDMLKELFKSGLSYIDYKNSVQGHNVSARVFIERNSDGNNLFGFVDEAGNTKYFIDLVANQISKVIFSAFEEYYLYDINGDKIDIWPN
jgi:hypothetical protein